MEMVYLGFSCCMLYSEMQKYEYIGLFVKREGVLNYRIVENYRFKPCDLKIDSRRPGISGFMRVKNGEDFIEATIRSHINVLDEIVVGFNDCADNTKAILLSLKDEYGDRLTIIDYRDSVYPLASPEHAQASSDDPSSMANYSNTVLAHTRYDIVVKVDDDHIAIGDRLREVVSGIRSTGLSKGDFLCFSGLNLAARDGVLGVLDSDPVSGSGDVGFLRLTQDNYFYQDKRFERFRLIGLKRRFVGLLYWHMKYMKQGAGFNNYQLDKVTNSRFHRKYKRYHASSILTLSQLGERLTVDSLRKFAALIIRKQRDLVSRDRAISVDIKNRQLDSYIQASIDRDIYHAISQKLAKVVANS